MRQTFFIHALVSTGLLEQIHRHLLQHACADTAQHIVSAALLDDDVVNACLVKQLAQQQARGTGTDDGDLSAHDV